MTDDRQVKRCPFCHSTDICVDAMDADYWSVTCDNCYATGPWTKDQQRAIAEWNKCLRGPKP